MLKIILWGIVIYFIYRFVFDLVVPVSKATKQVRQTMQQMQQAQKRPQKEQATTQQHETKAEEQKPNSNTTEGEYIDFEEVK